MSQTKDILRDRSIRYLNDARLFVTPGIGETGGVREEVGRSLLRHMNTIMKSAIDLEDLGSFIELERRWQEVPDESDSWEMPEDAAVGRLIDYRRVLAFGLAMWSAHLLRGRESSEDGGVSSVPAEALRQLAGRFEGAQDVFAVYRKANRREDKDRVPWTSWFLSELPDDEAHMIPTSSELLFTALLLALVYTSAEVPDALEPSDWMRWHSEEIERILDGLEEEGPRWVAILGVSTPGGDELPTTSAESEEWRARVGHLRELIGAGRSAREEEAKEAVRQAPLDEAKVAELRSAILEPIIGKRVVRDLFAAKGAIRALGEAPTDRTELSGRQWIPKSLLAAGSNVVGISTVGRQISRSPLRAEVQRLLAVLSEPQPAPVADEEELAPVLGGVIADMRAAGLDPSLILAPVGIRVRHALGIDKWKVAAREFDPWVPAVVAAELHGSFDGVPVLGTNEVDDGRLWAIDLARSAEFWEWPSDRRSGVRLEFETFTADEAMDLIKREPNVAGTTHAGPAATRIQESVLLTQWMCWLVDPGKDDGARAVEVPETLTKRRTT
jgi:hypothetical protein